MRYLILLIGALALLFSCQSVPTEIPVDLTQAELIQYAQEAADQENWDAAIAYYSAILERFPQDRPGSATALYEISFIRFKKGDLDEAREGFEQLLGMYDFEENLLPQWPRTLAEKLLAEMEAAESEPIGEG